MTPKTNTRNASDQLLRSIKPELAPGPYSVKSGGKSNAAYDEIVAAVVAEVRRAQADDSEFQRQIASKTIDDTLARILFELNARDKAGFSDVQLAQIKLEVGKLLAEPSVDVDSLKAELAELLASSGETSGAGSGGSGLAVPASSGGITYANKEVQTTEDEKEGPFQDSTVANNFKVLNELMTKQFDALNKNVSKISGGGFGLGIVKMVKTGFGAIGRGLSSLKNKVTAPFKKLGRGISKIAGGIKGLGSKIGHAVASPFKAVGGFLSKLNPFGGSRKKQKEAARKEKLREKMLDFMTRTIDRIIKLVEPFIKFVTATLKKYLIIPVMVILANILTIGVGLTLLVIGAVLAYKWIKAKLIAAWEYVTSGQMLKDILAGLGKAWEWVKDFGKWLWDITIKALKFILVDVWVMLGEWIWEKLTQFGNWLYNEFIYPWLVAPFKLMQAKLTKFLEPIFKKLQPFIDSAQTLIHSVKKAFSSWDSNKSIWENLKNISSIIKETVAEWWETSPFKTFFDTYIAPAIQSLVDLKDRILSAFSGWDSNKSFFDNIAMVWGNIKAQIQEWWKTSVIKKYYDKLVNFLSDLMKPIVDWYNQSALKKWIDKIADFGKAVKNAVVDWWNSTTFGAWIQDLPKRMTDMINKLGNMTWDMGKWIGVIRPFGFLIDKAFRMSGAEADEFRAITAKREEADKRSEEIAKLREKLANGETKTGWFGFRVDIKDKIAELEAERAQLTSEADEAFNKKQQQLAQATVQAAENTARPLIDMENMKREQGQGLSEEAKTYSVEAVREKQDQAAQSKNRDEKLDMIIDMMNKSGEKTKTDGEDVAAAAASGAMAGGMAGGASRPAYGYNFGYMMENR